MMRVNAPLMKDATKCKCSWPLLTAIAVPWEWTDHEMAHAWAHGHASRTIRESRDISTWSQTRRTASADAQKRDLLQTRSHPPGEEDVSRMSSTDPSIPMVDNARAIHECLWVISHSRPRETQDMSIRTYG